MYGYVRAGEGELKMRDYELYRAFYCGLCREMGRRTGLTSRVSLSYDAAFLAIVRCAVVGEGVSVVRRRCFVHPMKKRVIVASNGTLDFVACASAVLVRAKLDDVKADERGAARFAASLGTPWASGWRRRGERRFPGLEDEIRSRLAKLEELEKERCASIDEAAGVFGDLMGEVASFGLDGTEKKLLRTVGELVGRFIYVCDACDDAAEDVRRGRYNPLVEIYGKDLCEKRAVADLRGKTVERGVLRPEIADEIAAGASMLLARLDSAVDLIDFAKTPQLEGIVKNIVRVGLGGQLRRALGRVRFAPSENGGENDITESGKDTDKSTDNKEDAK